MPFPLAKMGTNAVCSYRSNHGSVNQVPIMAERPGQWGVWTLPNTSLLDSIGNRTPDLLISNPTPFPFSHLCVICYDCRISHSYPGIPRRVMLAYYVISLRGSRSNLLYNMCLIALLCKISYSRLSIVKRLLSDEHVFFKNPTSI